MNGKVPARPEPFDPDDKIEPTQIIQVVSTEELADKLQTDQRLARQASHYAAIVSHFLTVKNSSEIALAMDAHFQRLTNYHETMMGQAES